MGKLDFLHGWGFAAVYISHCQLKLQMYLDIIKASFTICSRGAGQGGRIFSRLTVEHRAKSTKTGGSPVSVFGSVGTFTQRQHLWVHKDLLEHRTRDSCCTSPVTTTEVLRCTWPCLAVRLQSILPAVKRNKCTDKKFPSLVLSQTKFLHLFCP